VRAVARAEAASAARRWLPVDDPAMVVVAKAAQVEAQLRAWGTVDVRPLADILS
jgi:hypothetical protein